MSRAEREDRAVRIAAIMRNKYFQASLTRYHWAKDRSLLQPELDGYIRDVADAAVEALEKAGYTIDLTEAQP